ncbi:Di-sulfide bridge nucleocytoplasmic transport domain-containing protein [Mrakia frigida]|uniref:Brr6/Brl1 family protein n=1 Tax=Mrakia frigida TaxID=29902 RepID=UPI003FCC2590
MYGSSSSFHSTRSTQPSERRSTAGPMEWEPENPRKRPHYDPSPSPFSSSFQPNQPSLFPFKSAPSPLVDSPFLFHTNNNSGSGSGASALGSAPRGAMIPGEGEGGGGRRSTFDPSSFDFGNTSRVFGIPEVEMDVSTPTKPEAQPKEEASWYGIGTSTGGEQEEEQEEPTRKVASGAVRREMRKREGANGGLKKKGSVGGSLRNGGGLRRRERERAERSESEGSASEERSDDDRSSSRRNGGGSTRRSRNNPSNALQRTNSNSPNNDSNTQNFNLHLPGRTVSHGEIPYILLGYLQFFFNLSLVLILLYLAVQFILTVKSDIARKVEEVSFEILQEIASCTNLYLANQCDPERRVPGMQASCTAWEYCMNRDPTIVGRAKVGAETFAGVVNSFVDPISWKTMSFTLVTLTFLTIVLNSALSFYRSSHRPPSHQHEPQPSHHRHQIQQQQPPWQQYSGLPPMGGNEYASYGVGGGYSGLPPRAEWEGGAGVGRLGEGGSGKGEVEGGKKKKGWF